MIHSQGRHRGERYGLADLQITLVAAFIPVTAWLGWVLGGTR